MSRPAAPGNKKTIQPRVSSGVVVPLGPGSGRHNGHDELNVARLSLISAQSRVPADYTNWTRTYQAGGKTVTVTCTAITGQVVPHGLDNDVMVAIINLYLEDGCPEDGTVRVSMHRLQRAANLNVSAREVRRAVTTAPFPGCHQVVAQTPQNKPRSAATATVLPSEWRSAVLSPNNPAQTLRRSC